MQLRHCRCAASQDGQRDRNPDAYGRLVDADGALMSDALALEATADDQIDVTLAKQGANDDLFLAYTDNRNGNPDLYGERYVPPIASFAFAPSSGTAPLTVVFTDTSIAPNGIDAWLWSFGDGVTSTLQSPTHTYSVFGTYAVSLTVTSNDEGDRSSVAQITVLDSPPPNCARADRAPNTRRWEWHAVDRPRLPSAVDAQKPTWLACTVSVTQPPAHSPNTCCTVARYHVRTSTAGLAKNRLRLRVKLTTWATTGHLRTMALVDTLRARYSPIISHSRLVR